MSLNVLVIPEDFRKDQYIVKPLVEAMLTHLGKKPRVSVLKDPLLGGISQALRWDQLEKIIDRYRGMTDLFLLLVDRDCDVNRHESLANLEVKAREVLGDKPFVAQAAWQELEVWLLAAMQDLPSGWAWATVRADCNPKEAFYLPYARQRQVDAGPAEGRRTLGIEAGKRYGRVRQRCREDVEALEVRLRGIV